MRAHHPDLWVCGEMIHGDYAAYVGASGIDSVTQYELWKAIWSSLNDRNLFELAHALSRHAALLRVFLPLTFVGNHDVTRIATQLVDERSLDLALAVLFTVPGVPSVYYGDERGRHGVKEHRPGGDDAIRPAYPASPEELDPSGAGVLDLHRALIALRRRHGWLNEAAISEPDALSNEVLAFRLVGADRVLGVVLNVGDTGAAAELRLEGEVLLGSGTAEHTGGGTTRVRAEPHSFVVVG